MADSKTFEMKFSVDEDIFMFGDTEGDGIARVLEALAERFRSGYACHSNKYQNIMGPETLDKTKPAPIIGTFRLA